MCVCACACVHVGVCLRAACVCACLHACVYVYLPSICLISVIRDHKWSYDHLRHNILQLLAEFVHILRYPLVPRIGGQQRSNDTVLQGNMQPNIHTLRGRCCM